MTQPPATPPLLFTKRLTTFLSSQLSTLTAPPLPTPAHRPSHHTHTLLLTTATGKLLAHASDPARPARELRAQGTIAASLVSLYAEDLSHRRTAHDDDDDGTDSEEDEPLGVAVQLGSGGVVVRKLACGLLLVCLGPGDNPASSRPASLHQPSTHGTASQGGTNPATPAAVTPSRTSPVGSPPGESEDGMASGAASLSGASARTVGVVGMRRFAEEVARALDERLGGLEVPGDALGSE